MNIVSFLAPRRDHGRWTDTYFDLLAILDRSCKRLGLRHVVMTDNPALPTEAEKFVVDLPESLMKAATTAHWKWLLYGDWREDDTCFVGVDCIVLKDPTPYLAERHDMGVTYRGPRSKYPINTGLMHITAGARSRAEALYRTVMETTGDKWCADQRALQEALAPLPATTGIVERAGMMVEFMPMRLFNEQPGSIYQPMTDRVMLHFRGKADRKQYMVDWAAKWLQ